MTRLSLLFLLAGLARSVNFQGIIDSIRKELPSPSQAVGKQVASLVAEGKVKVVSPNDLKFLKLPGRSPMLPPIDRSALPIAPQTSTSPNALFKDLQDDPDAAFSLYLIDESIRASVQCLLKGFWGQEGPFGKALHCPGSAILNEGNRVIVYDSGYQGCPGFRFRLEGELFSVSGVFFSTSVIIESLKSRRYGTKKEVSFVTQNFLNVLVSECAFEEVKLEVKDNGSASPSLRGHKDESFSYAHNLFWIGLPVPRFPAPSPAAESLSLDQFDIYQEFSEGFSHYSPYGKVVVVLQTAGGTMLPVTGYALTSDNANTLALILGDIAVRHSYRAEGGSLWVFFERQPHSDEMMEAPDVNVDLCDGLTEVGEEDDSYQSLEQLYSFKMPTEEDLAGFSEMKSRSSTQQDASIELSHVRARPVAGEGAKPVGDFI